MASYVGIDRNKEIVESKGRVKENGDGPMKRKKGDAQRRGIKDLTHFPGRPSFQTYP